MPQLRLCPLPTDDKAALVDYYPGQQGPQQAQLILDLDTGECEYRINPEVGSNFLPVRHWFGCVQVWPVPLFTPAFANRLLDEIAETAQRLLDDAETVWDGDRHVGKLGPSAQAAYEHIVAAIETLREVAETSSPAGIVHVSRADEFYSDPLVGMQTAFDHGLSADTGDDGIDRVAERIAAEALDQDDTVLTHVEGWLADLRDSMTDTSTT